MRMQTTLPVKIMAVNNAGDVSPVGLVDVKPMINQIDNQGKATRHETIYNIPYMRLQGGANAIIIDPEVGDIGICCFASRDISKLKSTKAQSDPGSLRTFSFSDGIYIGGILNSAPTQYVQFNADGIKIHSPSMITLEAPDIQFTCETMEIQATTSVGITTPTFTVNGATQLNGSISQGAGSSGGVATIIGPINVTNGVTASTVEAGTITGTDDVIAGSASGKTHHHQEHDGPSTGGPL